MSGYPKASCDPGTVALRLANERADRWKQRHDALAARPVIVIDPAEARDTVLRAVHNAVTRRGAGEDWDTDDYQAVTNDVLAALAGQEQP